MHQEILQKANQSCRLPKQFFGWINFKPPYNRTLQAMLLPHIIFSSVYHHYQAAWQKIILPSEGRLKEFWKLQSQAKHPAFAGHPVLNSTPEFQKKMVPLALHGDGTPVIGIGKIWSRQLTIYSFNSLLGHGTTKDMQLHVWSCFDECCGPSTKDEFFTILSWSLEALQKGRWPESNHLGQKYHPDSAEGKLAGTFLANGYCGLLWSLVGDLEYFNQVLQLPHYSNKTNPCALCRCSGGNDDTSWKDCRLTAPWLSMQWKPTELLGSFQFGRNFVLPSHFVLKGSFVLLGLAFYKKASGSYIFLLSNLRWASWPQRSKCVLFQKLSGLTAVATSYDWMHAKLLGTDMVFHGSCLWILCNEVLPHTPSENLQICWQKILSVYKEKKIVERYRGMSKLSLFQRKKGGPKLKGRAAQVAAIAEPMLALWLQHMDKTSEQHKQIRTWLKLNVSVEKLIKNNEDEIAFAQEDHLSLKKMCFGMAQLHRNLNQSYAENGAKLFADIPKLHAWLHSALASCYLNPRLTWCFRQEDNMNVHRTLAQSCCRGMRGPQVTAKMVAKMRIALHLQLDKM